MYISLREHVLLGKVKPVIAWYFTIKSTVQRKRTEVESDNNRKIFLSHEAANILF
jgi:hypothetical protein